MEENNNTETLEPRHLRGEARFIERKDIRYRGPLSYRWLRILGWLCFALSMLGIVMGFYGSMKEGGLSKGASITRDILSSLKAFMMPLFLLANFSLILRSRSSFKKMLIFYGGLTGLIILAYYVFILRYVNGILGVLAKDPAETKAFSDAILGAIFTSGLNVFLDLFLCTLFAFFINYEPKKFFQGKKIIIFRLFSLLVVAYEVVCFLLSVCHVGGTIVLPAWIFPWLTCKSMLCFFAFAAVVLWLKVRQKRFVKNGGTNEEYEKYLLTNRNAWKVSVFIAIAFTIAAVIDVFALGSVLLVGEKVAEAKVGAEAGTGFNPDAWSLFWYNVAQNPLGAGIGSGVPLILVAPIALLFCYTKEHKNPKFDKFIPFAGIGLGVLTMIEGIFFVITHMPK